MREIHASGIRRGRERARDGGPWIGTNEGLFPRARRCDRARRDRAAHRQNTSAAFSPTRPTACGSALPDGALHISPRVESVSRGASTAFRHCPSTSKCARCCAIAKAMWLGSPEIWTRRAFKGCRHGAQGATTVLGRRLRSRLRWPGGAWVGFEHGVLLQSSVLMWRWTPITLGEVREKIERWSTRCCASARVAVGRARRDEIFCGVATRSRPSRASKPRIPERTAAMLEDERGHVWIGTQQSQLLEVRNRRRAGRPTYTVPCPIGFVSLRRLRRLDLDRQQRRSAPSRGRTTERIGSEQGGPATSCATCCRRATARPGSASYGGGLGVFPRGTRYDALARTRHARHVAWHAPPRRRQARQPVRDARTAA